MREPLLGWVVFILIVSYGLGRLAEPQIATVTVASCANKARFLTPARCALSSLTAMTLAISVSTEVPSSKHAS